VRGSLGEWRAVEATFIRDARADGTNRAYRSMLGDWKRFAAERGCPAVADHVAVPRILRTIRRFVAQRGAEGKRSERHLTAIRSAHVNRGFPDPTHMLVNSRARLAAKGVSRTLDVERGAGRKAAPASVAMLAEMRFACGEHKKGTVSATSARAVLAAAVCASAGCLRLGALVPERAARLIASRHWRTCDLAFGQAQVTVRLRSSKTEVTTVSKLVFKATGSPLCPVRLLRRVLESNLDQGLHAPVFQRGGGGTIVRREVERALSGAAVRLARPAAEVARLTGHSFRVGMVQALLGAGYDKSFVQDYGRWKSESAFRAYLRSDFHELAQPAPGSSPDLRFPLIVVGL
jgi:hypothetical protein